MRPETFESITLREVDVIGDRGNGDSKEIETYLAAILLRGKNPVDVVREIWVNTYRGKLQLSEAQIVVDGLVDKLPEEVQQDLVLIIGKGEITPLTQARETARKQVEAEERKKRPPKGQRIHTRREKAMKRRESGK